MFRSDTLTAQAGPKWFAALALAVMSVFTFGVSLPLSATEIPLVKEGGVYAVPVRINGVITLKFIVDSGAADVQIPADVALTLIRAETITQEDFLPGQVYRMADGSTAKSARFVIRRLEIGDHVAENVQASVGSPDGPLLLGQSLLSRLPAWSLDNQRHVLILSDAAPLPPQAPTEAELRLQQSTSQEPLKVPEIPSVPALPSVKQPPQWYSDWGNEIRASALTAPCSVSDFAAQGYRYALSVDIPLARLGSATEAWAISDGRAETVHGCWFQKSDGLVHVKMRRKKDGKVWEQDLNFQDGSWVAMDAGIGAVTHATTTRYIYFAAETPPTDTDIPAEAPLCYRFNVATLEDQLGRLKRKYGDALHSVQIRTTRQSRMLNAQRNGDQGEIINYYYFEDPDSCMEFQRARFGNNAKPNPQ